MGAIDIVVFTPKFRLDLESFPSTWEIVAHLFFFMLIEDTVFYWLHRLFHTPTLYKLAHKTHHEIHYSVITAIMHVHPIDHVFGNIPSIILGYGILGERTHFVTVLIW